MTTLGQAVLIGDVVASRAATDRADVHRRLSDAVDAVNRRWGADLRITVGDEYQGTVPTLGAATRITLEMRVALLPDLDVRLGLGLGATTVLDPERGIEDGPGWWAARGAIDDVEQRAARAATRHARTGFRPADDTVCPAGLDDVLNAALLGRDELIGRLDDRSLSVLRGLLSGRTQREIAEQQDVSASAVSQRVREHGLGAVLQMTTWLEGLR